jgi:outer membrane receptor protein involved in Fe transport
VPGFQVALNAYGAPLAGHHGMSNDVPEGLQVLIDGRTQYSTLLEGGVGWNLIDVAFEEIERIEVLRGSNSPAYGSNAFMGVVNVVTRHATTTGVLAQVAQGNQGIADRHARIGWPAGAWHLRLAADHAGDDGLPVFFDSRQSERVNLRADGAFGPADTLRVLAAAYRVADAFQWTQNGATDAYHRLDWLLAWRFQWLSVDAELCWAVRSDGEDHAEWYAHQASNPSGFPENVATRHFLSLRIAN